ncbi:hypothetical protein [Rhodoplanes sp. Z2-YC6860]|uniref:hypothetical protein n=1 Tax=Rhodoplanes sp. Z2-YC6860 TaxID=674703 RepID=UPI0012ED96D6|nr:hypothetical protein [Rhodoplanes sp. Z2-YC6860]
MLDAFDTVLAKGSFKLQLGTVTDKGTDTLLGTSDDVVYQAMVLTLGEGAFTGATAVQVFIGVGGVLDDSNTPQNFSDDQIDTAAGLGFFASLPNLSLITLKNNNKTPTNRLDDKSYLGLQLSNLSAALIGIDGLTLGVYGGGVKVNQAKDSDTNPANDPAKLDWTTFFNNAAGLIPAASSIPNVGAGVDIEVQGSLVLNAYETVLVKGSFKLQLGTVTDKGNDHTLGTNDDKIYQEMVLTLGEGAFTGATAVQVFIGVGGVLDDNNTPLDFSDDAINTDAGIGFVASLQNLSLITLKNNNKTPTNSADDKSYLGLDFSNLSAALVGIDGLTLGVYDGGVKVNQAKDGDTNPANDPAKLDWTTFFNNAVGLIPAAPSIPNVDAGVDIEVQGSLALDAFGVVFAKGSFSLQLGTVIDKGADHTVGGGDDIAYQAMVLTLGQNAFVGASAVEVFIGVGGVLDDNDTPQDFSDDSINTDSGIGFSASLESLNLITLKNGNKSYLGLELNDFAASLIGVNPVTINVWDVSVQVNQAKNAASPNNDPPKLDWNTFFNNTAGMTVSPSSIPHVAALVDIVATGSMAIDIDGYVQVSGSFGFSKLSGVGVTTVTDKGVSSQQTVNVVTIGLSNVDVFFGDGPYFKDTTGDGQFDTVNPDAVGLLLQNVNLALVLAKAANGLGSYYAVSASAQTIKLLGLDLGGSSSFDLSASGYRIEINGGSKGVNNAAAIDFSKMTGGKLSVPVGGSKFVDIDFTSTLQRVAIENARLTIENYLYVSGGLALTRQKGLEVKLDDLNATPLTVNALEFGAGSVDLFAGTSPSPYFADTDGNGTIDDADTHPTGATGLVLQNVNFGFMIMRPTLTPSIKYVALKATASFAGLVGIDDFTLSASGITVEYNGVKNPTDSTDTTVVDFKTSFPDPDGTGPGVAGLPLDLGNGTLNLDFDSKRLLVSIAEADLQISSYVFVHGSLAFEKADDVSVMVTGDTLPTKMFATNIGASDLTIFVGANGPYWTDLDGSNDISWAFNTGFGDAASRTITAGSVTIGTTTYGVNSVLPAGIVVKWHLGDDLLTVGGVTYGDKNHDTFVDVGETGELNPDAVGFTIVKADLGMTLLTPQNGGTTRYTTLKASSDFVGFVGTDIFHFEASSVVVQLNLATRPGVTDPLPVVNFTQSFPGGLNGLFAVFDANNDHSISTAEMDAALIAGYTGPDINTVDDLVTLLDKGGAPPANTSDGILQVSEVVSQLKTSFKNATALNQTQTNLERIQAADSNNDGKYDSTDPVGYEVKTGGESIYLDQTQRQIHASADNVQINVSDFVYINGNVAIDLGSRETVSIRTGIPADIGQLGANLVTGLNSDLHTLAGELETLKQTVVEKIQGAIAQIQTEILGNINSIVDLIVAQLHEQIDAAISNVTGALASQVQDLTAGLAETIGGQLDGLFSPITSRIPAPLDSLVKLLLKPVKDEIIGSIQDSLEEALTGGLDRVASSVSTVIGEGLDSAAQDIKAQIAAVIQPQINRITSKLNQLFQQVSDKITPVFNRVEGFLKIDIGDAFATIDNVQVDVTAIGFSNATAFVGVGGPYWSDLDGDHKVSWAFNTGTGDTASRKITAGSVTIDGTTYVVGDVLPANVVVTLKKTDGVLTFGNAAAGTQVSYGDKNGDGIVDAGETGELATGAIGLFINNLNMALGIFRPVVAKQLPTFTALKLTADSAGFVGGDTGTFDLTAKGITVELNLGGPIVQGAGPLVGNATIDFPASFQAKTNPVTPAGYPVATGTTTQPIYLDFVGEKILARVEWVELTISQFVHIAGSFSFEKGAIQTVNVTGGLLTGAASDFLDALPNEIPTNLIPATGAPTTDLQFLTIGASDVHAFIGLNGPYWTDLDGSEDVSWAFKTGTDTASRTITAGSVTIGGITYDASNPLLPANTVVRWLPNTPFITVGGVTYGDKNGNHVADVGETGELNGSATGLVIDDFDFGMAIMRPTNPLDFVKYFALKATANAVRLVGVEDVTVNAENLEVEINQSTPGIYGVPLFPVVDFATTYPSEQQALFDVFAGADHVISTAEMSAALATGYTGPDLTTADELVALLHVGGAPPGTLTVKDVIGQLATSFATDAKLALIQSADLDNDGKFDPAGYEVDTGGTPVYLDMDSALIRAQGFLQLSILDNIFITGSVAFELGPTHPVTLTNGDHKTVTTMTIGAADVTAFIGANGPYWTDTNGDHQVQPGELNQNSVGFAITDLDVGIALMVSTNPKDLGVYLAGKLSVHDFGLVGVTNLTATGTFDVELNVGIGASGLDLNVNPIDFDTSFDEVQALFNVIDTSGNHVISTAEMNAALTAGYTGGDVTTVQQLLLVLGGPSLASVLGQLSASFKTSDLSAIKAADADGDGRLNISELQTLFNLIDTSGDSKLEASELNAALPAGYSGATLDTVQDLLSALYLGAAPPASALSLASVLGKLSTSFKTAHLSAIQAADFNVDGKLDFGFNVNTGNPAAPVVLDFNDFLVSIHLGGVIELKDVFRMTGLFLFDADTSGLKAFVAAGLEIGPDIGSSNQILAMNALGALVITHAGVAADIEVSVSIGGALSDVLQLNAKARLLLNTTGQDLTITIPKNYVDFLVGNSSIPDSPDLDATLISSLTTELSNRLTLNADGSATFTISGTAPDATTPGFYLVVTFHADLTIVRTFVIEADFRLEITDQKFDLGFDGKLKLGGFGSFDVSGGAVIDSNGFAAYGSLTVDINLLSLVHITGSAELKINTATSGDPVTVNGHDIAKNTYLVSIQSSVTLFGIVKGSGDLEVGVDNGVFVINVKDLSVDLFILNVGISGYIRSDGQFNLTGSLSLPSSLRSDDFGITGSLSVTISNSGFKAHGDVGLIVFGQSFNVASADLSVTFDSSDPSNSSVSIRAEGPLGVYVQVTIDKSGFSITGGLGFLDNLIDAVKDAVNAAVTAVGDAVVTAANAVAGAFTDLGNAILDLGNTIGDAIAGFVGDVGDFLSGIADSIAQAFSSSRTIAITFPPTAKYSYSTALSDSDHTLTIDMSGGDNTGLFADSPLSLAVVNGQLVVDGPDASETLLVAERQHQTRSWDWGGAHWGSWHNDGDPYGFVYANIKYSNMKAFDNITKVIILGTSGNDTIIFDTASITQDAVVYGYAGNDTIITGNGNDYVDGGDGNDIIYTYGGNDVVYGGNGNDTIVSGTGNDTVYGGDGNDVIDESQNRGNNPKALINETNTLNGGAGNDVILGSPGKDTIDGGTGNDTITGLANDDTYVFENGYGKDVFADFSGKAYLDFSAVTDNLVIGISDGQPGDGLEVDEGTGNSFSIQGFIFIQQQTNYSDFQIAQLKTGTGNDHLTATALPLYALNIVDAGGHDTYDFDLDQADVAQSVARVDIVDNGGSPDLVNLDVDSTDLTDPAHPTHFDIYLHPQEVLLNHLDLTFNTGVEQLHLTDRAAATAITTKPGSGFSTLLIKTGVTITQASGGDIELDARGDFTQQAGSLIETTENVVIYSDVDDVAPPGAVITLFGPINANHVTVYGTDDNDTVNVGRVTSPTDVYAGAGDDTINVGTPAPGTVDGINGNLNVHGEDGSDTLNIDDTGDGSANTGTLTATTIAGLDMTGIITYDSFVAVNVGLGTADDDFTIESTHAGTTVVNGNNGNDVFNIQTISGPTTVNGGNGSDTFNVGSKAPATGGVVDGIAASLTLNGNAPTTGSDWLNVDETGDTKDNTGTLTSTQITGLGMAVGITYGTIEHVVISLGSGNDQFTIEATHDVATPTSEDVTLNAGPGADTVDINDATMTGALVVNGEAGDDTINMNGAGASGGSTLNGNDGDDIINLNAVIGPVTVNGGNDADTVNVNDVTDVLVVNGGAGGDTINVNATRAGSKSTLNGDAGDDVFNVRAMNGPVDVNGGADNDTINVADKAPLLPAGPRTTPTGTIDDINALLNVDGGGGTLDALNIDDSAAATNDKSGTLTDDTLSGLELEVPIHYLGLEKLSIWLGSGANTFTINSTHAGETTVYTAKGNDTVYINGASGLLTVNGEEGDDTFDVRATGLGSEVHLNGQEGSDTFNLSDLSPALPAAYPATLPPPAATTSGKIDSINGLVVIDGGLGAGDDDVINIDDSANTANKAGTLTSSTLRGLDMEGGVDYANAEEFNLWLGTGTDGLYIDSTHAGTTNVFMGDGNATVNQRDDTVAIRSIGGTTTIHGQGGNDFFYVNVQPTAANDNDPGFFAQLKLAAAATANDNLFNALFQRTNANGIGGVLNLHGEGGSDQYTVDLAGEGDALINVLDNGAPNDGVDTLIVNGADKVIGLANNPNDTFLLRRDLVALVNTFVQGTGFTHVERVNYDENINARLIVNGLGGDDTFVVDDNSAITTLDGGDGNDTFQIGQVFGLPRTTAAGLDAADTFDTTPVIIGLIRDPVTNAVLFDPTSFDPINGVLSQTTIDAINAAIAHQAALGLALNGIAYVSQGVTYATTVFGGAGADTFNVYHNKGTLRLEGEEGNDVFTVRAFVTLDLSKQGNTEVNGGDGADTINYAVNAPVSLDGGPGFDKVVVLGTPFNDNFVVTSQGIFGGGLNVAFDNIESAELDTLEGNDTIYVLGTNPNIITTVIGGLGSDTIQVMGDVTKPIASGGQGSSGEITQGLSSGDPNYNNVGADGVAVSVLSPAADSLVKIEPSGAPLTAAEGGDATFYFISLVSPDASALASKPVYLTVSAGVASSADRANGGAGVLVSTDGTTFTNAVVLTFDGATATKQFKIWVKAIDDTAAEGPRVALISHSIVTNNPTYKGLALADIFVNVVDNDQPGLDIRNLVADTLAPDTSTQILEGASGFSDVYSVALTAAPVVGEIVTVTLSADDKRVTAKSKDTNLSQLTFTADNWNKPQYVVVSASDDSVVEGTVLSTITHQITSTGGKYSAFPSAGSPKLTVTVYDDETPGLIVQETDGSTTVVENGANDSYSVRLTSQPSSDVTLTMRADQQTFLSGAGVQIVDQSGTKPYFEYSFTFTAANWNKWQVINVSANTAFVGTNSGLKAFPPQVQNLDQIRGPLIIEGGVGSNVDRSLSPPVLLPNEIDSPSLQVGGNVASESNDIDTLNVFNTDTTGADVGRLYYRTTDAAGHSIVNGGLALTGFKMGGDLVANQGTAAAPDLLYFGGGITYNGLEVVDILLGKGNDTLTIDDTGDRDEKAGVSPDPATITAVHGGGGDDTIIANNRGHGPLVIYGDTSDDGVSYSNDQPAASDSGTKFNNPGNDTIDASAMPAYNDGFVGVVIYGGPGNDTIYGSQGNDQLAGGSGDDTIHAGAGNDNVYGDAAFNVNLQLFAQDQIARFNANDPAQFAEINAMFTVATTPAPGADHLYGDDGADIILGDQGIITQTSGTRRIETTGAIARIETTREDVGGADTIQGNAGNDIILGGAAGDTIDAGEGNNIVFGDHGYIDYVGTDSDPSDIDAIVSTSTTAYGGADQITAGAGQDIIIGGRFGDTINAGDGDNLVIGDSGRILAATSGAPQLAGLPITLGTVETIEVSDGGNDSIVTGAGNDIVLGGAQSDDIRAGAGNDIVLGDNGQLSWIADGNPSTLDTVTTTADAVGGSDTIRGEAGDDVLIGGAAGDRIDGGLGRDLIFGDNVRLDRTIADGKAYAMYRRLTGAEGGQIYSTLPGTAGNVLVSSAASAISGGPVWQDFSIALLDHDLATQTAGGNTFGDDYIAGGGGDDMIFGELGNDIIQGDGSIDLTVSAKRLADGTLSVQPSVEATTDGNDYIEGNGGNDVIFGNLGQDDIIGGSSNLFNLKTPAMRPDGSDLIFGGAGTDIARDDVGDGSHGRDADMILGDNGNIYRIVGTAGFNYDNSYGEQIVVRAAQLIDYTPGGPDYNAAAAAKDIGAADEIHGESGDDFIYGGVGNDVLFGEGQDDQIIGGWGNDWISGGTGDDAILGDDGRIFVSRNSATLGEPLYGIAPIPAGQLNAIIENSNGNDFAITNVDGALKYTVDLTPYSVDPTNAAPSTTMPRALYANDIIYGGLGDDSLHGGAGDDAISGGEALPVSYVTNYNQAGVQIGGLIRSDYAHPVNPGNVLGYNPTTTKFALYDANDPLRKILLNQDGTLSKTGSGVEWALNFDENDGPLDTHWITGTSYAAVPTDGDDVIFGDLGNDWMVGGTGRDTMWGGWGDDLANADDKLSTFTGPDTNPSWEDLVYGGAGRDVLIGNTGGDRLIDWNGEFNSYWLPYNPYGLPAVSRGMAPALEAFLLALSKSQGADPTLAAQYGGSAARNGEPFGETGMTRQGDAAQGDQNGGPRDPQGPVAKAKQDVKVSAGVQPLWETADESAAADSAASTGSISNSTLAPFVEEAKLLWTETLGAGDARLRSLDSVNVQVGNLPDDRLGLTLGSNVYIDSNAAGHGWQTTDLLSVVMHELGHVLGFDHDDASVFPVMNGTLDVGAHDQPRTTESTAASSSPTGFFAGADTAQRVIGLQSSGVSVVMPAAGTFLDGLDFSASWMAIRVISLLGYTMGTDVTDPTAILPAAIDDKDGADGIHGDAGDGWVHRMAARDILASEGRDDGGGNDWIVSGTSKDHAHQGWRDDLIDMDDDQLMTSGLYDQPGTDALYNNATDGGAGRDVLAANIGGDRPIDWTKEFSSSIVPFGAATIGRARDHGTPT